MHPALNKTDSDMPYYDTVMELNQELENDSEKFGSSVGLINEKHCWMSSTTRKTLTFLGLTISVLLASFAFTFAVQVYFSACTNRGTKPCDLEEAASYTDNIKNEVGLLRESTITNRRKTGAQLTVNQTVLKDSPPRLKWSHQDSITYLDGINRVTYEENDCLETTMDDRYLITIQLSFHLTLTKPPTAIKSYLTLLRVRGDVPRTIAKSLYMVPGPSHRANSNVVPRTIVLIEPLLKGDRLCVTVSHPELIYGSNIDNFFGVISL